MELISVVAYHGINYADTKFANGAFRDVVHGLFQTSVSLNMSYGFTVHVEM